MDGRAIPGCSTEGNVSERGSSLRPRLPATGYSCFWALLKVPARAAIASELGPVPKLFRTPVNVPDPGIRVLQRCLESVRTGARELLGGSQNPGQK